MKTTGTMLLFLALAAIVALCASEEENPSWPHHKKAATMSPAKEFTSPTQSTTIPVTNHTTLAPTTNHTIPMTNLTTAAPITNHTTHAPITNHTTHAPITNHTTPAITNHTTPMTNHTTHAPITNHTTATTPAPKPTPPAVLEVGDYSVKEGKVVCVRARLAIQLKIQYNVTGGKQPNKTTASGNCQDKQATLILNFKEGSITFLFQKDNNYVFVKFIKAEVNYTFTNTESHFSASNNSLSVFGAGIGRSYSCKNQSVMINSGFYLETSQQQVQAFNITKGDFGPADFCPADQPNYTIAIAVGVVLAILIVIVIIAYLISRRRGQAGYQTL